MGYRPSYRETLLRVQHKLEVNCPSSLATEVLALVNTDSSFDACMRCPEYTGMADLIILVLASAAPAAQSLAAHLQHWCLRLLLALYCMWHKRTCTCWSKLLGCD